ncbi:hypothetical protein M3Y94_00243200 [Aphelenchoides besseyi]|nr:hypothetical protein M3Y94_00243200 [Aphelenchoides besseyi]
MKRLSGLLSFAFHHQPSSVFASTSGLNSRMSIHGNHHTDNVQKEDDRFSTPPEFRRYPTSRIMDCQCNSRGSINLIVGPMFSGKTTELLRQCRRHTLAKRSVVIVKYKKDTRYDDIMVCTHDSLKMEGLRAIRLADVWDRLMDSDVIGIDEGQFFEDVVERAELLANCGKTVIVAALDGDYKRKQFESIAKLVPLAEKVEKITAVCQFCGHSASFTLRTIMSDVREVIGGAEMYQAVCRHCYHRIREEQARIDEQEQTHPIEHQQFGVNETGKAIDASNHKRPVSAIENKEQPADDKKLRQVA